MRNSLKNVILNLIFPPQCVFCNKRLSPKSALSVCFDCENNLPYTLAYKRCKKCGKPIAQNDFDMCRHCSITKNYATRTTAPFVYIDQAKCTAIAFKKERNAGYAKTLSFYIEEVVKRDFKNVEFDFVVSVPPRKKTAYEKRYDQAATLAKAVALRLGIPYLSGAMIQTDRVKKQSTLSYSARVKNVRDKFKVRKPESIAKKTILLIDDICTSGATINECAKVLRENGAYRVYAATLTTVPAI